MQAREKDKEPDPQLKLSADEPLAQRVIEICDAVGAFIEYWGFRAIHGRIWVLLALSKEPLSQSEIASFLEVSRSLVSPAVAELSGFRLVKPVSEHRNSPYRASLDVWPTITDVLRTREWMLLEQARLALEAASDEIAAREDQKIAHPLVPEHLHTLLRMTEVAQMLLRIVLGLGGSRLAPTGLSGWLARAADLARTLRGVRK
jgi:DNA-binding transcriptional regulator GbsR (MarR family)